MWRFCFLAFAPVGGETALCQDKISVGEVLTSHGRDTVRQVPRKFELERTALFYAGEVVPEAGIDPRLGS